MTSPRVLTRRALNRALLDRQFLLARSPVDARQAVRHLVGLQTQVPGNHYTALWSRLAGFDAEDFSRRFAAREFVRIALQRSTIHTVTADDCLVLRPFFQPATDAVFRGAAAQHLRALDHERLGGLARKLVEESPLTFAELGAALAAEASLDDPRALGQAARAWLPLVQVPPRGLWRQGGAIRHTTAEHWLGAPLALDSQDAAPEAVVRRYLAAFGPASVKDAQNWSGLTGLRAAFTRLRDELVVLRDENGVELFDLPDAPRPDADVPAPVRFLPEYDNVFLGHADRTRVISAEAKSRTWLGNRALPVWLADGFVRGIWRFDTDRAATDVTLVLTPLDEPTAAERAALDEEGAALLAFHHPQARHGLRWE
ncbi:winged helix DNA-binding domain-containing protein [Streptomyces avicenniae]|uniref:winged helix DNA-binding domain-containing protein n=1 Tax=Streptomyces avicenniae TaxID=500153 RepID=UPI00069C7974|nr:winged helix DNA-binding domain-containing protein [Streptomyces avicenniae]